MSSFENPIYQNAARNLFHNLASLAPEIMQPIVVEEDSTIMKVLSCVPLLGLIPSYIQENSLAKKIETSRDPCQLIALINVKNEYKVARVIHECFFVALAILLLVLGATGLLITAVQLIFFIAKILGTLGAIDTNAQVVERLQALRTIQATQAAIPVWYVNDKLTELLKNVC